MGEHEIFQTLKTKYDADAYALIPQVRSTTGTASRVRTADALAVSLWPSRGIGVEGFEFKSSRTDWLKELKDPAKAEEIGRYCEKWWAVTSEPGIVHDGELPKAWGLMEIVDGKIKVKVKAPGREAEPPRWPFVAAVMRAASTWVVPESHVQKRIDAARQDVWKDFDAKVKECAEKLSRRNGEELKRLQTIVHDFEAAAGVTMGRYSATCGHRIGSLAKVLANDYSSVVESLRGVRNLLSRQVEEIDAAVGTLPVIEKKAA